MQKTRIGLISDTHGLLRPEALTALAGVDLILHAGDVGDIAVLDGLRALAPVHAIRGNIDVQSPCAALPETLDILIGGVHFHLVHDRAGLKQQPPKGMVLFGHSHKPFLDEVDGVTWINPGSAGKRRFSLPVCLAIAEIENGHVNVRFVNLLDEQPLP